MNLIQDLGCELSAVKDEDVHASLLFPNNLAEFFVFPLKSICCRF